jgi:hypothetical protein
MGGCSLVGRRRDEWKPVMVPISCGSSRRAIHDERPQQHLGAERSCDRPRITKGTINIRCYEERSPRRPVDAARVGVP